MSILSSFVIGPPQADGSYYVTETHVLPNGASVLHEYLCDPAANMNPPVIMEAYAEELQRKYDEKYSAELIAADAAFPPLTVSEFQRRFPDQKRIAMRAARKSDPTLDDFWCLLESSPWVRKNDPDLLRGLGYCVSQGYITQAEMGAVLDW